MREVKLLMSAFFQHYKIVSLVQLVWLEMLILISKNILDMVLDLIDMGLFHILVVELVEM